MFQIYLSLMKQMYVTSNEILSLKQGQLKDYKQVSKDIGYNKTTFFKVKLFFYKDTLGFICKKF